MKVRAYYYLSKRGNRLKIKANIRHAMFGSDRQFGRHKRECLTVL